VVNFLNYVAQGSYNNDIFHRLDTSPPVLQGGGFTFQTDPSRIIPVEVNPAIKNEFSASHPDAIGTIAMAKQGGNADSATSQFFFNLADNSTTLGANNNGGFTVFGQVASGADMRILNTLAAFPVKKEAPPVFDVSFTVAGPKPTMTATSSLTGTKPTISIVTNSGGAFPSIRAVQTITFAGAITGGTFKLTFNGTTTDDIKWSANKTVLASNIQSALTKKNIKVTVTPSTDPFNVLPLKNYHGSPFPAGSTASNFSLISSIGTLVAPTDHLTFSLPSNVNSVQSIVNASINANDWLLLHPLSSGTTTITVTATDDFGSTAQVTFTVKVPVAVTSIPDQTSFEGDTPPTVQATASDANGLNLTFSATGLPQGLNISSSGLISGTIANDAHTNSPYTVVVTASDGTNSASQKFTWNVKPVVTFPTTITDQTNHVRQTITPIQVQGHDEKSNPLTFSATHLPSGLSISSSGEITGKLTAAGTFKVTITATDITGPFSNTQTFTWKVLF